MSFLYRCYCPFQASHSIMPEWVSEASAIPTAPGITPFYADTNLSSISLNLLLKDASWEHNSSRTSPSFTEKYESIWVLALIQQLNKPRSDIFPILLGRPLRSWWLLQMLPNKLKTICITRQFPTFPTRGNHSSNT